MKHNNYDAEQLYKEYMQGVGSDPSAIEDILSGEREPAAVGARIKHSTGGKMATITAAAAVVAVCAGIGFANMNTNDDSSIKPAANKPETTLVTTTQQQVTPQAKDQKHFETKVTGVYASDHGLRVFVKVSALTDDAKKMVHEQAEKIKENKLVELSPTSVDGKENNFTIVGTSTPVFDGDSFTAFISYELINSTETIKDGTKAAIRIITPDEYIAGGKVTDNNTTEITITKNMSERVFKSANGKTLWLSDFQFNCNVDLDGLDKFTSNNFEMKFENGDVKTPLNMQCGGSGGLRNGEPNTYIAFYNKIDSTKVTSIKYAGEIFTPVNSDFASVSEAKKAYTDAALEKQKLIKKDPNADTNKYDLAMTAAAEYVAKNSGSDILCAGLTSDKHFIAAACFSGKTAQTVKASADKMAETDGRIIDFVLMDRSGSVLCKCYVDWCHTISGSAYVQLYSDNAVDFTSLPDGAVLKCLSDSSAADINFSLTAGDLGTTLFNNIKK